jgi:hypothetical protein
MPIQTVVRFNRLLIVSATLIAALYFAPAAWAQGGIQDLQRSFAQPPDDARIMMRWWWFGPAVTKPEIERELRVMKAGGIGGVEIQAVYPLALDDPATGIKNLPFLSDEHLEALRFASEKGRELGMRIDLTLGSGWPFGGPTVSIKRRARYASSASRSTAARAAFHFRILGQAKN